MSAQKHTPGPWHVSSLTGLIYVDERRNVIGSLSGGEAINEWTETHAANASLIAAAPELLSALIACRNELIEVQKNCAGYGFGASIDDADLAIQKAVEA